MRRFIIASALVVASLSAGAQTAPASFTADGWRMLHWPMSIDEARAALTISHIAFTSDARTGMFPRGSSRFAEVTFETLHFREGDREVRVEYENYHLSEVRVIARRGSRVLAEQELSRLRRQWGEPSSQVAVAGVAPGTEFDWTDRTTHLALFIVRVPDSTGWFATEVWTPATPWPSWR